MCRCGRQGRGQGRVFVTRVRQTAKQLLELGSPIAALAQAAQQGLQRASPLAAHQRERLGNHLPAALEAHHAIRNQSRRLTQGKRLHQGQIVHASEGTIAPILKGKSNCPVQFGRQPGLISEPPAGFLFAMLLPMGNPPEARSGLPLVDRAQAAIARVKARVRRAIHAGASDLGANAPTVRQLLHGRGILTVGIPKTIESIHPTPPADESRTPLTEAGLNRQRTPDQVPLASAWGYSRPVGESHMASVLSRGAGPLRYKGPHGAVGQLGMTVMAYHGAALVRIRQQRLSKRAQKFRRFLGLRRHNVNEFNSSIN
jgi:hypothetical protein